LRTELDSIFAGAPAREWTERFVAWGVPGAEILDPADLLDHPQMLARGLISHRPGEPIPDIADPARWIAPAGSSGDGGSGDGRPGVGRGSSPALGQHTDEIVQGWLGAAVATD